MYVCCASGGLLLQYLIPMGNIFYEHSYMTLGSCMTCFLKCASLDYTFGKIWM
jgi:hypothetical protein